MTMTVNKYGVHGGPTDPAEMAMVRAEFRGANVYRNTLTEIEREYRYVLAEIDDSMGLAVPRADLRAAISDLIAARAVAKAHRAATRGNAVEPWMMADIKKALVRRDAANFLFRSTWAAVCAMPTRRALVRELNERRWRMDKDARALKPVAWGTGQLVELAALTAAKTTHQYDGAEVNLPNYVRFCGEGSIGVQVQNGISVAKAFDRTDRRIQLKDVTDNSMLSHPTSKRSQKRRYVELRFRIDSDDSRRPIWVTFQFVMHRPLPPMGAIKAVAVHLRHIGPREEWSVTFTVELPAGVYKEPCGEGMVAINFGWRVMDGGFRMATCVREGTKTPSHFILANKMISSLRYNEHLSSVRDTCFNAARHATISLLARTPCNLPQAVTDLLLNNAKKESLSGLARLAANWCTANGIAVTTSDLLIGAVRAKAKDISYWKAIGKLASLVMAWCRATGIVVHHPDYLAWTEPPVTAWTLRDLAIWRYHDHHLWEWEKSQQTKSRRSRNDQYRNFAAKLAREYDTLLIDTFKIPKVAEKPEIEDEDEMDNQHASTNRQTSAPSILRDAIREAFLARGGKIEEVGSEYNTLRCHNCDHIDEWTPAVTLLHTCSACGMTWDQDLNNTLNLFKRLQAQKMGAIKVATKRPKRIVARRRAKPVVDPAE